MTTSILEHAGKLSESINIFRVPAELRGAYSLASDRQLECVFRNRSNRDVMIYWLNFNGVPQYYYRLKNLQTFRVQTFSDHKWIVRDAKHGIFMLLGFNDYNERGQKIPRFSQIMTVPDSNGFRLPYCPIDIFPIKLTLYRTMIMKLGTTPDFIFYELEVPASIFQDLYCAFDMFAKFFMNRPS